MRIAVCGGFFGRGSLLLRPADGRLSTPPPPQDLALAEGALPRHLHTALFTQSADGRLSPPPPGPGAGGGRAASSPTHGTVHAVS